MDDVWLVRFVDETAGQAFGARVTGTIVEVELESADDLCHGASLNLAYSAVVVPDAIGRLAAVDAMVGGYTNSFIRETLDCGEPAVIESHVVMVQRLSEDQATYQVWFFYYGPDDTFAGQCGPCATQDASACEC